MVLLLSLICNIVYHMQNCLSRQYSNKIKEKCGHWIAEVMLDYPDIQLYSAQLHFTATFTGLQYIFYQWPVFSFVVGTAFFFVPVLSLVLVIFYIVLWKPYRALLIENTAQISVQTTSRILGRIVDINEESTDLENEEQQEVCDIDTVTSAVTASESLADTTTIEVVGTSSQQPGFLHEEELLSAPSKR